MAAERKFEKLKVFISYSRRDSAAADALVEALAARGFEVTIDRRDLPFGEKWQAELAEFIRLSDTVVWLVSDASVQSKWVNWELDEVARRNKRLVPVMIGETARDALPRQLGEIHILPAEGMFNPSRDLNELFRVLETDRAWLKEASRLQDRAHEWLGKSRASGLLLSRGTLSDAERWKERRPAKAPAPAPEVMDLLLASRQAATRRQRWWVGGSLSVMIVALALSSVAFWQRQVASENAGRALTNEVRAIKSEALTRKVTDQSQTTESGLLAKTASSLTDDELGDDSGTAVLLALEGLPDQHSDDAAQRQRRYAPEAELQLSRALRNLREKRVFAGHTGEVVHAAWSPDGLSIVTASTDKTARVWDVSTGKEVARLERHANGVKFAEWSPNGKLILTVSIERVARIWSARTGEEVGRLKGDGLDFVRADWSPDGTRIVTVSNGRRAQIWDAETGVQLAELHGHEFELTKASWNPNGSQIVTSSNDKTARVWDAVTGKEVARFTGHTDSVMHASWSPDGTKIATSSSDRSMRVWDVATGKQYATFEGHRDYISIVRWNSAGSRLVTASADQTVRVWELATRKEVTRFEEHCPNSGLHSGVKCYIGAVSWSADGTLILSASSDKTARVWQAETGKEVARLSAHCPLTANVGPIGCGTNTATWNPDGSKILTTSADKTARIWRVSAGGQVSSVSHSNEVRAASWSPDVTKLATAQRDGKLRVFDSVNKVESWSILAHNDIIRSVNWSPDGSRIVTASNDKTTRVWDSTTGRAIAVLQGHEAGNTFADWSPSGSQIITASNDNTARVWDAVTGKEVARFTGHTDSVTHASWSPDGTRIATSSADGSMRVWDATTGHAVAKFEGHQGAVSSVKWSSDGSRLVTASGDLTVRVWEVASLEETLRLTGHSAWVLSASWSPSQTRILSASVDRTARVWELNSRAEVARFSDHADVVYAAAWGRQQAAISVIVTASQKTARIWAVYETLEELVSAAKLSTSRCLTKEQRSAFLAPRRFKWVA